MLIFFVRFEQQDISPDFYALVNIKTTERYLHVSKKDLVNIVSPLDDLWRKGKVDW